MDSLPMILRCAHHQRRMRDMDSIVPVIDYVEDPPDMLMVATAVDPVTGEYSGDLMPLMSVKYNNPTNLRWVVQKLNNLDKMGGD